MAEPSPYTAPSEWSFTAAAERALSPDEVRAFVRASRGSDANVVHTEWDDSDPNAEALRFAHLEDVRQVIANEFGAAARIVQTATGAAYQWDLADGGRVWVDATTIHCAAP